jgi:hypothetical protein
MSGAKSIEYALNFMEHRRLKEEIDIENIKHFQRLDAQADAEIFRHGYVSGETLNRMMEYRRYHDQWPFHSISLDDALDNNGRPSGEVAEIRIIQYCHRIDALALKQIRAHNGQVSWSTLSLMMALHNRTGEWPFTSLSLHDAMQNEGKSSVNEVLGNESLPSSPPQLVPRSINAVTWGTRSWARRQLGGDGGFAC